VEKGRAKMIDPLTALAGLQSAISVVKKASKVANDLAGLAPSIAKMFDAKSVATKAMVEAKRSGNKSNLGTALQIEMALDEAKRFEAELMLLFQATGRADVWQKIKQRQQQMDIEDAHLARQAKAEEKKRKEEEEEYMAWAVATVVIVMFLGAVGWGIAEIQDLCAKSRCGR
jgi:preprotein translocase subunit Sss1